MIRGSSSLGVVVIPQAAGNRDAGCRIQDVGGVLRITRDRDGQGSTLRCPYIPQVIG